MNPPRRSALLGGLAGLGLFTVSFLTWFRAGDASADLWEAFSVVDVIAAFAIGCAVLTAITALWGDDSGLPVAGSSVTTGVATVAFVLLAYRLIDPPGEGDVERAAGAWLGVIAAGAIALLSHAGMGDVATSERQPA
jgi:hypothetical protein